MGGKRMKIAYKVWLDSNGKAFGGGPYRLLRNVERTGSLWKAAAEMGMSYSKAWRLMRNLERRLNFPLLERHAGGASGGGSFITPKARDLLDRYEKFGKDVDGVLEKIYQKHFGSLK
jgi:molybdate transport system regulatory protein